MNKSLQPTKSYLSVKRSDAGDIKDTPPPPMKGQFITFEGCDGSGKSTQAKLLYNYLKENNYDAILTREPGGVASAEAIRNLILNGDSDKLLPKTEILLHFAARIEHVNKLILPSLAEGKIVISDRFTDSSIAYQSFGHGLDQSLISLLKSNFIDNLEPDITFILDVDHNKGLQRTIKRSNTLQPTQSHLNAKRSDAGDIKKEDRYENMPSDFHGRVRQGFLEIAKANQRCHLIDATKPIDEISQLIRGKISL